MMWNKSCISLGIDSCAVKGDINAPSIITPTSGSSGILVSAVLTIIASAFVAFNSSYLSTDFEIRTVAGGSGVLAWSANSSVNLTATVPLLTLTLNTQYFVRARHLGTGGNTSNWSVDNSFTTSII
jgi:hypothetical protein